MRRVLRAYIRRRIRKCLMGLGKGDSCHRLALLNPSNLGRRETHLHTKNPSGPGVRARQETVAPKISPAQLKLRYLLNRNPLWHGLGVQNGTNDTQSPRTSGRPTCRSQDVRSPREPRPSRRTLRRDVSRQVLVELRAHIPVVFWSTDVQHWLGLHCTLLPRLEVSSPQSWERSFSFMAGLSSSAGHGANLLITSPA